MLIAAGANAAILAILLILRTNSTVSEWMASHFSRGWVSLFSRITSIFPFSLYETFLYVVIIGIVALIVTAIVFFCKRAAFRALTFIMVIVLAGLVFGNIYTLSAGFSYYRAQPTLPYYEAEYLGDDQKEELIALATFMTEDFNYVARKMERDNSGKTIGMPVEELSKLLIEEYKRLDEFDYYSSFTPRAKTIASKNIMSNMHITGVFFAPFGEANVNPLTPSSNMPVTMAHELAHSKGAMRESDANLVAYYITLTSENEYLRYSGYMACYSYLMTIVYSFDKNKWLDLYDSWDPVIDKEIALNNAFWSEYDLLDKITDAFNDLYLKLQGQKDGTGSYTEPTLPPDIVEIPSPDPDGGMITETRYNLNTVQKMMLKALKDRADAEMEQ